VGSPAFNFPACRNYAGEKLVKGTDPRRQQLGGTGGSGDENAGVKEQISIW